MKIFDILFEDGAEPEPHEIQTALFLRKTGKKITFIAPKNRTGVKTPDIRMDSLHWEIKSPMSASARSIEHAFRSALKQSGNVIFDLRRSKASDMANLAKINRQIKLIKGKKLRRVLVITKKEKLLDLK
ncbi:hypothetical protein IPM44_03705 [bacterium]|nr:MAG: hypothetical protein IPM44_03705 [bacterium]